MFIVTEYAALNFRMLCDFMLIFFFKKNQLFQNMLSEYHQIVEYVGSRLGTGPAGSILTGV